MKNEVKIMCEHPKCKNFAQRVIIYGEGDIVCLCHIHLGQYLPNNITEVAPISDAIISISKENIKTIKMK